MKIAICDDEEVVRNQLENICEKAKKDGDEIYIYGNGREILDDLPKKNFDLLFLDIEMPQINGIEIKNRIEGMNRFPCIVFVTSHEKYVLDAYGLGVIKFVKKPIEEFEISEAMERCRNLYNNRRVIVVRDINSESRSFMQKDIVYIKSEGVYSAVHFNGGVKFLVRRSLSEWEKDLDNEAFCRLSRSLLINFDKVNRLNDCFFMENGDRLKIPRRKGTVRKQYWEYIERGAYKI